MAVRVNAAPPADAEVGDKLVSVGAGFVAGLPMVKVVAAEVPPPGVGVNTVTAAVPEAAMSAAGTEAVSFDEER